jgi:hypothetical protein
MTTKAGIRHPVQTTAAPEAHGSADCPPPIADVLTYTSVQSGCDLAEGYFG